MRYPFLGAVTAAGAVGVVGWVLATRSAEAQPAYAIRSGGECDSCHVEPTDWANPQVRERVCSLNCTTCHVSPAGGGLRTPSGVYYGRQSVPLFGHRPSDDAVKSDHETDGGYRLLKGFSGWAPGDKPASTVADRYGKLDPDPTFWFGGDARALFDAPTLGGEILLFPMQLDLYGMVRASKHLVVYGDLGAYGNPAQFSPNSDPGTASSSPLDYFKVDELFVKFDRLPYNGWVRAGRLRPTYGWNLPDHSTFTRRDLGFGELRSWYGVEAGINPNYPYASVALFYQGISGWPADTNTPGFGASVSGGLRELGWQAGGNAHVLKQLAGGVDVAAGPQGAVNLFPVTYLGELDLRLRTDGAGDQTTGLYAYHEVQYVALRGIVGKLKFDWEDPDVTLLDDHLNRVTIGADLAPYTGVELEPQFRHTWQGGSVFAIGGTTYSEEVLIQLHGWL